MTKTSFTAPDAPPPIGPYSAAVAAGDLLFLSGQVPLDGEGHIAGYSVIEQARKVMENMKAQLTAAGLGMDAVVKTTVFLTDIHEFQAVNDVYAEYFTEPYPARSTVQVSALPKDVKLEIEAIAVRG